jgi:hypothetical protein
MFKYLAAIALIIAVPAGAAHAQQNNGDDVPPGTKGSGVITLEQMTEDLQFFRIEQEGIFVHFVLPAGWELVEEGVDPATGEVDPDIPAYVLLSRSPIHTADEPTDFIFELDIYHQGLTEDLPADLPEEERNPGVQLWNFLNAQMSLYLKGGLTCRTARNEIEAKPYGTTSPQRQPTFFVPLAYDTPTGAELYTFTTFTGDKVWTLKFLVAEDQIDNYGALIALILDNSFGLTEKELKEQQKNK